MKVNVKINNQVYEVEIGDLDARPILATIGCDSYEIYPEEITTAPAVSTAPVANTTPTAPVTPTPVTARAAANAPATSSALAVNAPIPGVIISIAVGEGDQVKYGQELLTLEAMKMKNAIRATRDGRISKLRVNVGDHVKHGQILVEFAE
ncbi:MAG: biotin/lipoyl-containing protein [Anaerolineaceae bacterium]